MLLLVKGRIDSDQEMIDYVASMSGKCPDLTPSGTSGLSNAAVARNRIWCYVRKLFSSPGWVYLLLLLVDVVLAYGVLVSGREGWTEEGAMIENLQAAAMAFSFLILVPTAFRVRGLNSWLIGVFALTCWAFLLREVEVQDLNVHKFVIFLGSGIGRDVSIVAAYVLFGLVFLKRFLGDFRSLPSVFLSRVAMVVVVGCLFLVLGAFFEPLGLMFFEELTELNGALLILWGAVLCAMDPKQLTAR